MDIYQAFGGKKEVADEEIVEANHFQTGEYADSYEDVRRYQREDFGKRQGKNGKILTMIIKAYLKKSQLTKFNT